MGKQYMNDKESLFLQICQEIAHDLIGTPLAMRIALRDNYDNYIFSVNSKYIDYLAQRNLQSFKNYQIHKGVKWILEDVFIIHHHSQDILFFDEFDCTKLQLALDNQLDVV